MVSRDSATMRGGREEAEEEEEGMDGNWQFLRGHFSEGEERWQEERKRHWTGADSSGF